MLPKTSKLYQPSGEGGIRSQPAMPDSNIPSMSPSTIQYGLHKAPEWLTGSGKGCIPRFLGAPVNFCKISFLI